MTSGLSIKYPLEDDPIGNFCFAPTRTTKEKVRSKLRFLLSTVIGSRYYRPKWGANPLKYIFEPNDNRTLEDHKNEINQMLARYMPEVSVGRLETRREVIEGKEAILMWVHYSYQDGRFSDQDSITI